MSKKIKSFILAFLVASAIPVGTVMADDTILSSTFEGTSGGWYAFGSSTISTVSTNSHGGSSSLYVTDRTDSWNGVGIDLAGYVTAGSTYNFNAWVMQNSSSTTETINLTLKWLDSAGNESYNNIGSASTGGSWSEIDASYTIPSEAVEYTIYFECENLIDFYIDDVTITGTAAYVPPTSGDIISLKDAYKNYFKIGSAVSAAEVSKPTAQQLILTHFNSITPENELKPDALLQQYASQQNGNNVNPQVALSSNARTILQFCDEHDIPMRGHVLVWHSQTPDWFFKENFSDSGAYVSKDIMNQRMENYIKNVMELLATEFPNVEFYAWDVANEVFQDGKGVLREAGSNYVTNGTSLWTQIYGDDSFIENAFTYARKYAPEGCKLFYNDFNEYIDSKRDAIYELCSKLYAKGVLDGVGMQSHLDVGYPSVSLYTQALDKFSSIGCEIHITELDITTTQGDEKQAEIYKGIFDAAKKYSDNVTSLTLWGTQDGMSWRGDRTPLIFDSSYQPKPAYYAIVEGMEVETETTTAEPTIVETDIVYGDTNLSGNVEIADAIAVMAYVTNSEKNQLTAEQINCADVYQRGDGIAVTDAVSIQKYLTKLITELPES